MANLTISAETQTRLTQLFDRLKAAGILTVTVDFNGSGDEGSTEDGVFDPPNRDASLVTEVDAVTLDLLEAEGTDWYNNDGGFGTVSFDVRRRKAVVDMSVNVSSSSNIGKSVARG